MMSGREPQVVAAEPLARATEPGHHLVGDQQYAVLSAHLSDGRPVVRRRHARAERGTRHRLGDERGDTRRPDLPDQLVERVCVPRAATVWVRLRKRTAILVRRGRVPRGTEPREVRRPQANAAGHVERTARVAVVGTGATDDDVPVLTARQMVRPGHLERGLDRLAAARHRVDAWLVDRQERGKLFGVRLERSRRESSAVHVRDRARLLSDRIRNLAHTVADSDDDGAARAVEVATTVRVEDLGAAPGGGDR